MKIFRGSHLLHLSEKHFSYGYLWEKEPKGLYGRVRGRGYVHMENMDQAQDSWLLHDT